MHFYNGRQMVYTLVNNYIYCFRNHFYTVIVKTFFVMTKYEMFTVTHCSHWLICLCLYCYVTALVQCMSAYTRPGPVFEVVMSRKWKTRRLIIGTAFLVEVNWSYIYQDKTQVTFYLIYDRIDQFVLQMCNTEYFLRQEEVPMQPYNRMIHAKF